MEKILTFCISLTDTDFESHELHDVQLSIIISSRTSFVGSLFHLPHIFGYLFWLLQFALSHSPYLSVQWISVDIMFPSLADMMQFQGTWCCWLVCSVRIVVVVIIISIIIIIIIILGISFMQGIYTYIPETNHVPREHHVAAIMMLLFMVLISLVPALTPLYL